MPTFIVGDKKFSSRNGENFNTARKHAKRNWITAITEEVEAYAVKDKKWNPLRLKTGQYITQDKTFTHKV